MNYDRLLQLGGIDREVPPIPQYISKDDLQKEIDDLKTSKQDVLVSGENIATINNQDLLEGGNIQIPPEEDQNP
jgi:hypothetical protein